MPHSNCHSRTLAVSGIALILAGSSPVFGFGGKKKAQETTQPSAMKLPETVWVMRADGSRSCGEKAGTPLEAGGAPLRKAGVPTLGSRKVHDGKMRTAVCGSATGMMNTYQIERKHLEAAIAAGYDEAPAEMSPKTLESGRAE